MAAALNKDIYAHWSSIELPVLWALEQKQITLLPGGSEGSSGFSAAVELPLLMLNSGWGGFPVHKLEKERPLDKCSSGAPAECPDGQGLSDIEDKQHTPSGDSNSHQEFVSVSAGPILRQHIIVSMQSRSASQHAAAKAVRKAEVKLSPFIAFDDGSDVPVLSRAASGTSHIRCLYTTNNQLLLHLQENPLLLQCCVLIIEVPHYPSLDTELLVQILHKVVRRRFNLRLVLLLPPAVAALQMVTDLCGFFSGNNTLVANKEPDAFNVNLKNNKWRSRWDCLQKVGGASFKGHSWDPLPQLSLIDRNLESAKSRPDLSSKNSINSKVDGNCIEKIKKHNLVETDAIYGGDESDNENDREKDVVLLCHSGSDLPRSIQRQKKRKKDIKKLRKIEKRKGAKRQKGEHRKGRSKGRFLRKGDPSAAVVLYDTSTSDSDALIIEEGPHDPSNKLQDSIKSRQLSCMTEDRVSIESKISSSSEMRPFCIQSMRARLPEAEPAQVDGEFASKKTELTEQNVSLFHDISCQVVQQKHLEGTSLVHTSPNDEKFTIISDEEVNDCIEVNKLEFEVQNPLPQMCIILEAGNELCTIPGERQGPEQQNIDQGVDSLSNESVERTEEKTLFDQEDSASESVSKCVKDFKQNSIEISGDEMARKHSEDGTLFKEVCCHAENVAVVNISAPLHPVELRYLTSPIEDCVSVAVETTVMLHKEEGFDISGFVWVFLPSKEEAKRFADLLQQKMTEHEMIQQDGNEDVRVISSLPGLDVLLVDSNNFDGLTEEQLGFYEKPSGQELAIQQSKRATYTAGKIFSRRCIFASHSLLPPSADPARLPVRHIIDCMFTMEQVCMDPLLQVSICCSVPVDMGILYTRASLAGRLGPGRCYRLCCYWQLKSQMLLTCSESRIKDFSPALVRLAAFGVPMSVLARSGEDVAVQSYSSDALLVYRPGQPVRIPPFINPPARSFVEPAVFRLCLLDVLEVITGRKAALPLGGCVPTRNEIVRKPPNSGDLSVTALTSVDEANCSSKTLIDAATSFADHRELEWANLILKKPVGTLAAETKLPAELCRFIQLGDSKEYCCSTEASVIASLLVGRSPWLPWKKLGKIKRQQQQLARLVLGVAEGDLLTLFNIMGEWKNSTAKYSCTSSSEWADRHCIDEGALRSADKRLSYIHYAMRMNKIQLRSCEGNSDNVQRAICKAFIFRCCRRQYDGTYVPIFLQSGVHFPPIRIHPSSILSDAQPGCIVFAEAFAADGIVYAKLVTEVYEEWLPELCPELYQFLDS